MIKLIALIRKKNNVSEKEFKDYYENIHAPLITKIFPSLKGYTRNYLLESNLLHGEFSLEPKTHYSSYNVITELSFDDEDELMMLALDAGAEDVKTVEDGFEVITSDIAFDQCLQTLQDSGVDILMSDLKYIPDNTTTPSEEGKKGLLKLIGLLEACEDVQSIEHNAVLEE